MPAPSGSKRGGFTLMELTISSAIFAVIAITLMVAVNMGTNSAETVRRVTRGNAQMRDTAHLIQDELKATADDQLTVTLLPDGNHQVDFRVPVLNGANFDWGVFDPAYGPLPADQNKVGWSLRYTVDTVPMGGGPLNRRLIRQVLDDLGVLQDQDVIVEGLRLGGGADPGFQMLRAGDMWALTVTTLGHSDNTNGRKIDFHVRLRN